MDRYLCLQRSFPGAGKTEKPSPQQMQEMYEAFQAWHARFADRLVDLGGQLGESNLVSPGQADGPFVEIKDLAGGYMIVQASSLEEATEIARKCPGLVGPGSGVEVLRIRGQ